MGRRALLGLTLRYLIAVSRSQPVKATTVSMFSSVGSGMFAVFWFVGREGLGGGLKSILSKGGWNMLAMLRLYSSAKRILLKRLEAFLLAIVVLSLKIDVFITRQRELSPLGRLPALVFDTGPCALRHTRDKSWRQRGRF